MKTLIVVVRLSGKQKNSWRESLYGESDVKKIGLVKLLEDQ